MPPISVRQAPYKIPEYSLTGDLLAYLTCGLQYRYHNRGSLPPSKPVQLWFGQFIHAVMEEAYLEWRQDPQGKRFPWEWDPEIRSIELQSNRRLRARGLIAPPHNFCPFESTHTEQGLCRDENHPHKMIASRRAEEAINTWGQHLFPLIDEAEVRLKSIRSMPKFKPGISRCNYYGITGVVDVISSVNLPSAVSGNLILHYIHQNSELEGIIDKISSPHYEIIIDYKGSKRPATDDPHWEYHEWQILTYAWLRSQQPQAKPIVAGIIFYLNELALSESSAKELQDDVRNKVTDISPRGLDLQAIEEWKMSHTLPLLSAPLRERRSIRLIPVSNKQVQNSLRRFDGVVGEMESCVRSETLGQSIPSSWKPNPLIRRCTACDFKTFCSNPPNPYHPTVP